MSRSSEPLARLVPRLAAAQLRSEWILSLCLVIALAAVIAPLLVLMGLKHGTIETLRERLVEDPVFREIRPARTREYAPEWFAALASQSAVQFLIPTILPLSSVLQVVPASDSPTLMLDLVPTGPGDPLILENGGRIPANGEVVLSHEAARQLDLAVGDSLRARVTRSRSGQSETVEDELEVVSILATRAGQLPRLYATLDYVVDVEAYKEGFSATARGWPGIRPEPYLSFDGALLFLEAPLPPIERTGLLINTGIAHLIEASPEFIERVIGQVFDKKHTVYALSTPGTTLRQSQFQAVAQKLRGRKRLLLPYVTGVVLKGPDGRPVKLLGRSLTPEQAAFVGLEPLPWGTNTGKAPTGERLHSVLLPQSTDFVGQQPLTLDGAAQVELTLEPIGETSSTLPVVPIELMAALRTGMERPLKLSMDGQAFEMSRGGYRGFRLYADSIDSVPSLVRWFQEQDIEVMAEVEAIQRIQVLDAGLGRIFWLIAVLGISGATAVLIASLYAAVERLRRDLGVLRLLGLARRHVFFFPVVQGLVIAAIGLVAALASYLVIALAINRGFSEALEAGEQFCTLANSHLILAVVGTLLLAVLSSLAAAWRATGIDPAEAIREN